MADFCHLPLGFGLPVLCHLSLPVDLLRLFEKTSHQGQLLLRGTILSLLLRLLQLSVTVQRLSSTLAPGWVVQLLQLCLVLSGLGLLVSGLDQRVHSPNRAPPFNLRSRFYAVVRAAGEHDPTIFKSSSSYWRAIGSLEGSDSISQAFPSEPEGEIYLQSAGFLGRKSVRVLPLNQKRWRLEAL